MPTEKTPLTPEERASRLLRLKLAASPQSTQIVHPRPLKVMPEFLFCGIKVRSWTPLTKGRMDILRALMHNGEIIPEHRVNVLGVWKVWRHQHLRRFRDLATDNPRLIALKGHRFVWLPYRKPATAERARDMKSPQEKRVAARLQRVLKKLRGAASMPPEKRKEIADMWQRRALRSKGLKAKKAWSMYYRFKS